VRTYVIESTPRMPSPCWSAIRRRPHSCVERWLFCRRWRPTTTDDRRRRPGAHLARNGGGGLAVRLSWWKSGGTRPPRLRSAVWFGNATRGDVRALSAEWILRPRLSLVGCSARSAAGGKRFWLLEAHKEAASQPLEGFGDRNRTLTGHQTRAGRLWGTVCSTQTTTGGRPMADTTDELEILDLLVDQMDCSAHNF
jgi:hypothetical protein